MATSMFQRTWVSPVTAVSFAAVAVTGVLMFLGVHMGSLRALHEWIGLVFAAAGAIHLCLNWRAFLALFKQRVAVISFSAATLLCIALLTAGGGEEGHGPHGPRGEWAAAREAGAD